MVEERRYPVSREYLLNLISDILELQNGKNVQSDTSKGRVGFSTRMYNFQHQYDFTVSDAEGRCCCVRLETDGSGEQDRRRLYQMFALLESLMKKPAGNGCEKNCAKEELGL